MNTTDKVKEIIADAIEVAVANLRAADAAWFDNTIVLKYSWCVPWCGTGVNGRPEAPSINWLFTCSWKSWLMSDIS